MNRPPACPRLPDERGNNESYWSGLTGILMLSPAMITPVCHIGDPLQLTCTAPVAFLQWSLRVVNEQGRDENITMFITASAPSNQPMPIEVNSTTFTSRRISAQFTSTLISTLSIDSVNIGLNGTVLHCIDPGNIMTSASTTIQVIIVGK